MFLKFYIFYYIYVVVYGLGSIRVTLAHKLDSIIKLNLVYELGRL